MAHIGGYIRDYIGFRLWGLDVRVCNLGFRAWGLGFRV